MEISLDVVQARRSSDNAADSSFVSGFFIVPEDSIAMCDVHTLKKQPNRVGRIEPTICAYIHSRLLADIINRSLENCSSNRWNLREGRD